VHLRGALRLQPVRVRPRGHAVRPAEQERHLLLRRRLRLRLLWLHRLIDPSTDSGGYIYQQMH
jgi:hypothetical protein